MQRRSWEKAAHEPDAIRITAVPCSISQPNHCMPPPTSCPTLTLLPPIPTIDPTCNPPRLTPCPQTGARATPCRRPGSLPQAQDRSDMAGAVMRYVACARSPCTTSTTTSTQHSPNAPSDMSTLATNTSRDTVAYLWHGLGMPAAALAALDLPPGEAYAASFKVARASCRTG